MKIAILGWGSLIWAPRDLPREGAWQEGGPTLPIEFSRVSKNTGLSLVIDPTNGFPVPTRFVLSPRTDLNDAINDLRAREGTKSWLIGFVNRNSLTHLCNVHPPAADIINGWAEERGFDAVVWTDLCPNFREKTGLDFSVENAVTYLNGLAKDVKILARKYIENAPAEVDTPLRRRLREINWLEQ